MTVSDHIREDMDLAFWLTRSIGRSIGLSFSDAMEEGRLTPEEFASLVLRCHGCRHEERCKAWLANAGGPKGASRAPEFCPNADALQALKPH